MNVITRRKLAEYWRRHPEAEGPLAAWFALARAAQWRTPHDIRTQFDSADFLGDNRVVFDIGGNKYRIVVRISYRFKQVLVKFVGTHAEYNRIDAEIV